MLSNFLLRRNERAREANYRDLTCAVPATVKIALTNSLHSKQSQSIASIYSRITSFL